MDARMRAWDLASRVRRRQRPASWHTVIASRSAFESSRSGCWAGRITSTDSNPPDESGPWNSSQFVFAEHRGKADSRLDLGCVARAHGIFGCDVTECYTITPQG